MEKKELLELREWLEGELFDITKINPSVEISKLIKLLDKIMTDDELYNAIITKLEK
jgi:hypothetical protein